MADKKNILNLSNEYINSLTKMEKYKLPIIFYGDLVFAVSFFILGAFLLYQSVYMVEFLPVGILALVTSMIYLVSIFLIKKERLNTGALLGTIGILFACLIILDICPADSNSLVYYRSGCFVAVMAICNQVVSLKRKQIHIFNIFIFIFWLIMIFITFPKTSDDLIGTLSAIAINTLGAFIAILSISSVNRFNLQTLESEISAEQLANKNLTSLTQILEAAKNGLSVGQKLVDETQKAETNISKLNELYAGIIKETGNLSVGAEDISEYSTNVLNRAKQMKETASNQNIQITNTSDALLKISGNISNLSNIAEQRNSNMKKMLETFSAEKTLIKQIVDQVNKVQVSSAGIAGFVKTVDTIANQTNLLAMNASIEAAHAGSVGKGFSVIAQEIRKLSIQTAKNAAQITEELAKNANIVQATTESVKSFEEYVQNTTQEMEYTIEMIEQLLSGIQSIDNENGNVMESLKDVVNQSNETNILADDVASEVVSQNQILTTMRAQISDLKTNIDAMNEQLLDIQQVINNIDTEAELNISVSKDINNYLE